MTGEQVTPPVGSEPFADLAYAVDQRHDVIPRTACALASGSPAGWRSP